MGTAFSASVLLLSQECGHSLLGHSICVYIVGIVHTVCPFCMTENVQIDSVGSCGNLWLLYIDQLQSILLSISFTLVSRKATSEPKISLKNLKDGMQSFR